MSADDGIAFEKTVFQPLDRSHPLQSVDDLRFTADGTMPVDTPHDTIKVLRWSVLRLREMSAFARRHQDSPEVIAFLEILPYLLEPAAERLAQTIQHQHDGTASEAEHG